MRISPAAAIASFAPTSVVVKLLVVPNHLRAIQTLVNAMTSLMDDVRNLCSEDGRHPAVVTRGRGQDNLLV